MEIPGSSCPLSNYGVCGVNIMKLILIFVLISVSGCAATGYKCYDLRREVEKNQLWIIHPATIPELIVEDMLCRE